MSVQTWTKQDKENHVCIERFFKKILGFEVVDLLEHWEIIKDADGDTYKIMLGRKNVDTVRRNFEILLKYRYDNIMFKPGIYKDWYEQLQDFYKTGVEGLELLSKEIYENETLSEIFSHAAKVFHEFTREELRGEWEYA